VSAHRLSWYKDENPGELRRWLLAAFTVAACHAALIGSYMLWHPRQDEVGDETSAIAIELTSPDIAREAQPAVAEVPKSQPQTADDAVLPQEKPPDKVVPPTPETVTTKEVVAAAPHVDPSWWALLSKHLQRFKNYPSVARARNEEGEALLIFTMDRNGHVLSRRIVRSSGHPDLDAEALAMVERAQPLPAFPASMTAAQLDVTLPIYFALR
jgi:protein TonB